MYSAQDVTKRIKSEAKEKSITLKEMLSSLELGINALQNVSDKGIASFSLAKIADYLDCSVDYLLGRTGNIKSDDLTLKETDLIENFKKLDNDDKEKVVEYTKALQQKKPVLIIENEPRYLVRRAGRDGSFSEEYLTKEEIEKIKEEANALEEANF